MQIEILLDKSAESVLTNIDKFNVSLNTGRTLGLYFYDGQTSKKEKELIKASFMHCK